MRVRMMLRDLLRACPSRVWAVAVLIVILAVGCTSDEPLRSGLAEGCLLNSDCNSPLVCAFRRCHNACESSRDCAPGLRCVVSDRPFHVCQLESERTCTYNSHCPEGQVCAVDAQCRDRCQADTDCLRGQSCTSGTCAEPSELREGKLPVALVDGGPSSGQPCVYNSQCPDRLVCKGGLCQSECLSSGDCSNGRQCVQNRCQVRVCPEMDAGAGLACSYSSDCLAPLVCRSATCTCECNGGGDCPAGYDCTGNRCTLQEIDTIGPEGGVVVSLDRRLTLEVPPGALGVRLHITITTAEAWPAGALGPVFEVRPSGTRFAVPATFVYRFQAADIAPFAAATVRLAVAEGPSWNRFATVVNVAMGTATAPTTHLSTYGLVGPEGPGVDGGADRSEDARDAGQDASACTAAACSGTVIDGCCPSSCTPLTDTDCQGCGNGRIDTGETCDPPGSCPVCDDQNDCTADTQTGTATTCNVVCSATPKTCSNAGKDRCCPVGCTAQNDTDCAGCGDGVVDPTAGETCDPPGTCPTACTPGQCWEVKTFTGSAATCNARCSMTQLPCSGTTRDGCCPPACNTSPANRDTDCPATCGNGIVDTGETCDPLQTCPVTCAQQACTLRSLANGGTCQAVCQISGTQTQCASDDGCCPAACNAVNDNNCSAVCGNGVLEPGERCEGASCPTSCPNVGCMLRAMQGTLCQRQCVDAGNVSTCVTGDGCCPANCTAMNDADCSGCGNGRVEAGETCDPPGSCPVCDDQDDCTADTQTGSAATCDVVCGHAAKTCSAAGNDRCCPAGCTAGNDSDCAGCGDGVVDPTAGETCDPPSSCPTACTPGQCWEVKTLTGSPATCNARCSTTQLACSGRRVDGCCPPGCNTSTGNSDGDCPAMCGNGTVETGETCDPLSSCPTSCPQLGCTLQSLRNGGTCAAACESAGAQTRCVNNDACCPTACNSLGDNDCAPVCGNGVVEAGELCDGNCPAACPQVACTLRTLSNGGTCQAACVDTGTQTRCVNGDGCCPSTGCNATTDNDCAPVCGNGVIEPPETCDGNCPTAVTCVDDANNVRKFDAGTAGSCDEICISTPRPCQADGWCPTTCSSSNDPDCPPANDLCKGAVDITNGGTYAVELTSSARQDTTEACSTKGPEVFYTFTLKGSEFVYLAALDSASPAKEAPVSIEMYSGACPPPEGTGQLLACDAGGGGELCGRARFPVVTSRTLGGKPLSPGQYFVAVRSLAGAGKWTLTYHHVPLECVQQGVMTPTQQLTFLAGNTCSHGNHSAPTCSTHEEDDNYAVFKCPNHSLHFTTCSPETTSDTVLSAVLGSMTYNATTGQCVALGAKEVACSADLDANLCGRRPDAAELTDVARGEHGFLTVSVDTAKGCGAYMIGSDFKLIAEHP